MKMLKRRQLKAQQEKPKKRRRTGVLVAAAAAFTVLAVTYFLSPSTHKVESIRQDAHQEQNQKKTPEEQRSEKRLKFFSDLAKQRAWSLMAIINAGLNYNPLLSELKNEYPYKSLDCRFVPNVPVDGMFGPIDKIYTYGKFNYDETFMRRADEFESLAKEKNIRALVSIIDFLDSLNIEAVGGAEFSSHLDQVLWQESFGSSMIVDEECWLRVHSARRYLGIARDCLIEIVKDNPSSMATVLSQLPESERPIFLSSVTTELCFYLIDETPNLHNFERIYLSLPERERKQVEESIFDLLFFWIKNEAIITGVYDKKENAKKLASLQSDTIANLNTQTRNLLERLFRRLKVGKHH